MDNWDRVTELLDSHRSQVGHIWQASLALTAGLITVVGFAVDRQSWGLGALALLPEMAIFLIGERFRRSAPTLLDAAAELEVAAAGDSTVVDAHRAAVGLVGFAAGSRVRLLAAAGIVLHVTLLFVVGLGFDWSFDGR